MCDTEDETAVSGRRAGNRRPANIVLVGFALGLGARRPLLIVGSGLGLLVSQLNNYTLSPIEDERVSVAVPNSSQTEVSEGPAEREAS